MRHPGSARPSPFVDEFYFAPSKGSSSGSSGGLRASFVRSGSRPRLPAAIAAGLVVVVVAALLVLRMSGGAEAQVFKYALTKGDKHTYDLSITITAIAAGAPNATPFQGTVSATIGYEVVETAPDGSSVVEFTLQNVRAEPNTGSAMPNGSKLRVKVAPDGSVTEVQGSGGVFGAAGAGMSSLGNVPGNPSDSAASQSLFPQFSPDAVAPGDSWSEDSTFPFPFGDNKVTVHATGKHAGFEEDPTYGHVAKFHHTIEVPLDLAFSFADIVQAASQMGTATVSSPPAGAENAVMKITGDLKMDADSIVVPNTSELLRLDGTGKMSMHMKMEGIPQGEGGPGDVAFDATMKFTMIRVDGAAGT